MLIRSRRAHDIATAEITPESTYLRRREILATALTGVATLAFGGARDARGATTPKPPELGPIIESPYSASEEPTSYDSVTQYNNFYEFGTAKEDPAVQAASFQPKPWSVLLKGRLKKPGSVPLETFLEGHALEERIYRFRCVETWSMVVPWVGIPLGDILKRFEPDEDAKFVEFRTLYDPERMPGQKRQTLEWPYREGLRMDEAMHPLTILAVGLYGRELPNQNGAPLRLIVPWKYGFKSIKSITEIRLRTRAPQTTWSEMAPNEYGFFANVNPEVDHPRWSQKRERRLGDFLRRPTSKFNGYADEVASLYAGMDLSKDY